MDATLTNQEIGKAEAREKEVLGDGPRINALEPHELSSELLDIIRQLSAVMNEVVSKADRARRGRGYSDVWGKVMSDPETASVSPEVLAALVHLPALVRILLRHPKLYSAHMDVAIQLYTHGTLSRRDRELAVLRIAWLCQAPYEWGEHVMSSKEVGFTSADIQRVIEGPGADGLDRHDRAILKAVDELHGDAMISETTWATLSERLNEQQLIELPIVVGHYQSTAYCHNSLRMPLESDNVGLKAR